MTRSHVSHHASDDNDANSPLTSPTSSSKWKHKLHVTAISNGNNNNGNNNGNNNSSSSSSIEVRSYRPQADVSAASPSSPHFSRSNNNNNGIINLASISLQRLRGASRRVNRYIGDSNRRLYRRLSSFRMLGNASSSTNAESSHNNISAANINAASASPSNHHQHQHQQHPLIQEIISHYLPLGTIGLFILYTYLCCIITLCSVPFIVRDLLQQPDVPVSTGETLLRVLVGFLEMMSVVLWVVHGYQGLLILVQYRNTEDLSRNPWEYGKITRYLVLGSGVFLALSCFWVALLFLYEYALIWLIITLIWILGYLFITTPVALFRILMIKKSMRQILMFESMEEATRLRDGDEMQQQQQDEDDKK